MAHSVDVSVVVVNYNTAHLTRACIASVQEHTRGVRAEIIVVDNASTECDAGALIEGLPDVRLIRSATNVGFAAGNALGVAEAEGRYIVLLNSDTWFTEDSLTALCAFMDRTPSAGVVSPRLVFPDGRHQPAAQRFPALRYPLIELLRLHKMLPRRTAGRLLLGWAFDHDADVRADWVWGTCFFLRRDALARMPEGRLDTSYFMYYEDMQWCMDLQRAGFGVHFTAATQVVHLMGGSSAAKEELMQASGRRFMARNYARLHAWAIDRLMKLLLRVNAARKA